MKTQLASDPHLELLARHFPGERLVTRHSSAEVLVLAGDIAGGTQAVALFGEWPVRVIYVMGSHEACDRDLERIDGELRERTRGTSIYFPSCDRVILGGVRFLGCAWWTNYSIGLNSDESIESVMQDAGRFINDNHAIRLNGRACSPNDGLVRHAREVQWLKSELAKPFNGPTVVVTHHGAHPKSVHPRYAGEALNGAFASDLTPLIEKVSLWLHGHVHDSFDYRVGTSRVVVNPRGYARNLGVANQLDRVTFENARYDPSPASRFHETCPGGRT